MHGSPVIPKGLFVGRDLFIVAGGPSLTGFDFNQIKDRDVLAINRAHQSIPWANVLYFTDLKCWHWYEETFKAHTAAWKITSHPEGKEPDGLPGVVSLARTGARGLEDDTTAVRHGNNSGYAAINVGIHFGPKRIILLGYDMKPDGDRMHWHPEHPMPTKARAFDHMIKYFEDLVEPISQLGISVFNTSMDSRLTCFPKIPFDRFL